MYAKGYLPHACRLDLAIRDDAVSLGSGKRTATTGEKRRVRDGAVGRYSGLVEGARVARSQQCI